MIPFLLTIYRRHARHCSLSTKLPCSELRCHMLRYIFATAKPTNCIHRIRSPDIFQLDSFRFHWDMDGPLKYDDVWELENSTKGLKINYEYATWTGRSYYRTITRSHAGWFRGAGLRTWTPFWPAGNHAIVGAWNNAEFFSIRFIFQETLRFVHNFLWIQM